MDVVDAGMNNIFGSKKKKTHNEEKQIRDKLRRTDAGRLLSGRGAEDDRELLLVADGVASGWDHDLNWMQVELRLRTLITDRERLKLSLIGVETRRRSSKIVAAGLGF
ncbi:hypothetical protein YC2023_012614 [Brassica napus]